MSTSSRKVRRTGTKPARRPASGNARKSTNRAKGKRENAPAPDSAAPDGGVDPDVLEFIEALDRFKRQHDKPFPTWSEVLWVVRSLGYRKA